MLDRYEPSEFEAKWRQRWKDADLFKTREDIERPKFYGLDFFPYPSGAGLSVGHCRNYIPTDVVCRMKYMQGHNVLHPMGFDAFGLPAENEAIKRQRHPEAMIHEYGATYRRQMELVGVSYDWSRSFFSSDPSYYRWTQWIFKKLHERGLAYRKLAEVNWCPKDLTALANEEVVGGLCERCGTPVERRAIPQWFMKITEYAQRLIDDLDTVDWPEGIKNQQRNWIGRSEGVQFSMELNVSSQGPDEDGFEIVNLNRSPKIEVFTTRIDTVYGVTFCVIAPEHPLVSYITERTSAEHQSAITEYCQRAKALSDTARQMVDREKTGVFTGVHAVNPFSGERIPLYVADYVLMGYGTGAIMAVPGHDQRDFDFARKFDIPIVPVISGVKDSDTEVRAEFENGKAFESKDGFLVNSGPFTGATVAEGQSRMADWIEANELGERKVHYKLRDWLISRQRYWGCPIPILYNADGTMATVSDDCLPVLLPEIESYEPTDDGQSPLAAIPEFVRVTDTNGGLGKRETDTLGGFACSSWYFLRFCDPHNDDAAFDPEKVNYWMPVDCYVGGAEHAVMHLLYARFWTKVLYDIGLVHVSEPFKRLQNQGQVLARTPYRNPREGEMLDVGEDGILVSFDEAENLPETDLTWKWVRMSKSKGNVVTPDEIVESYGADALRVYELFVAPFDADVQWSNEGMQGAVRFLNRIFKLTSEFAPNYDPNWRLAIGECAGQAADIRRWTHQTLTKVSEDIEKFAFNTCISTLMIFLNNITGSVRTPGAELPADVKLAMSEAIEFLVLMLAPIAPHSADELWTAGLGKSGTTYEADWPKTRPELAVEDRVTIAVQVNGKLRDTLELPASVTDTEAEEAAMQSDRVRSHIDGKTVRKVIVVKGKLVNIVAN